MRKHPFPQMKLLLAMASVWLAAAAAIELDAAPRIASGWQAVSDDVAQVLLGFRQGPRALI